MVVARRTIVTLRSSSVSDNFVSCGRIFSMLNIFMLFRSRFLDGRYDLFNDITSKARMLNIWE